MDVELVGLMTVPIDVGESPVAIEASMHFNAGRDEVATIWYALEEYKSNLRKTLAAADESTAKAGLEDEMFCHEQLSKIARVQFDIVGNHETKDAALIQQWLDI